MSCTYAYQADYHITYTCTSCSYFYIKLCDNERRYNYAGVSRWFRRARISIAKLEKVVLPIFSEKRQHWSCAVVNLRDQRFEFYDSSTTRTEVKNAAQDCLANLRQWLRDETKETPAASTDIASWPACVPAVAQQENNTDCGVFAAKFMQCIGDHQPLLGPAEMRARAVITFRGHLVDALEHKRIK